MTHPTIPPVIVPDHPQQEAQGEFILVPREPTEEMEFAGNKAADFYIPAEVSFDADLASGVYAAMLQAASAPSSTGDSEAGRLDELRDFIASCRQHEINPHLRDKLIEKVAALRAQPPQPTGDVKELVERLEAEAQLCSNEEPKWLTELLKDAANALRSGDSRLVRSMQCHEDTSEKLNSYIWMLDESEQKLKEAEARAEQAEQVLRVAREAQWQNISTAPKDGTHVIISIDGAQVGEARYETDEGHEGWYWGGDHWTDSHIGGPLTEPNGWMPMPAALSTTEAGRK
jgi:hypothetical protein